MNLDLLEITIDVLQKVIAARKPFMMAYWCNFDENAPCGTSACAFGYAALDPRLQERGLRLIADLVLAERNEGDYKRVSLEVKTIKELNTTIKTSFGEILDIGFVPKFENYITFDAASAFYDISRRTAEWLFDPNDYLTRPIIPEDVIRRIQYVIADHMEVF